MPAFELKCDPAEKMEFKGKLDEEATCVDLKLTNETEKRQAFKVKCTSNEMFRIRPPVGFVAKGETATVKIQLNKVAGAVPANDKHYLALYHIEAPDDVKAARTAWAQHKGDPSDVKKIFASFAHEGAAADEKKDEKKEDGDKKEDADAPGSGQKDADKKDDAADKKDDASDKKEE